MGCILSRRGRVVLRIKNMALSFNAFSFRSSSVANAIRQRAYIIKKGGDKANPGAPDKSQKRLTNTPDIRDGVRQRRLERIIEKGGDIARCATI
jgi:hypothetical protein